MKHTHSHHFPGLQFSMFSQLLQMKWSLDPWNYNPWYIPHQITSYRHYNCQPLEMPPKSCIFSLAWKISIILFSPSRDSERTCTFSGYCGSHFLSSFLPVLPSTKNNHTLHIDEFAALKTPLKTKEGNVIVAVCNSGWLKSYTLW